MITIAYMTCRQDPRIEWFFDSLHAQCSGDYSNLRILIVDFFADLVGRRRYFQRLAHSPIQHVAPKPSVWQGAHRLTSVDYFAASNARNTAVCYAPDGYLAYVDDLSVLLPGWLNAVEAATKTGHVVLGTYQKVRQLVVTNGVVTSYEDVPAGHDSRLSSLQGRTGLIHVGGTWLYGCSLTAPVQSFLDINGWDEDCDCMGAEDYACGHMIQQAGYQIYLNTNMRTFEADELHSEGKIFKRVDKPAIQGHKDGGHAYLHMLLHGGRRTAPNYFGEGGLAALRQRTLAGEPFPPATVPQHDWRDGQPLSEM